MVFTPEEFCTTCPHRGSTQSEIVDVVVVPGKSMDDPIKPSPTVLRRLAETILDKVPSPSRVQSNIVVPVDVEGKVAEPFVSNESDKQIHIEALAEDIGSCSNRGESGNCQAMAQREIIDLPPGVLARIEYAEQFNKTVTDQGLPTNE